MAKRIFGRSRALASLAGALLRVPLWLAAQPRTAKARRIEQAFFCHIVRGFGITVTTRGEMVRSPATLFVVNHISWADIALLASMLDADFVAKAEISTWPLLGGLAHRLNPVFVARNCRRGACQQADAIRQRLRAGRSVILCAEGTTSVGVTVLPFRSSLFEAAEAAAVIQPLAIRYCAIDGSSLSSDRMREVAWIDDDDLLSGALRVAKERTMAQVIFLPPISAVPNRKLLAQATWALVEAAYVGGATRYAERPSAWPEVTASKLA